MRSPAVRLAVIAGDGIGPDVTTEALKVLDAVRPLLNSGISVEHLPYGAEHYLSTGVSISPGEMSRLGSEFDVILVGALGDPRVPGNEHARDILLGMRFKLDLYVNERPARLFDDRLTPLKGKSASDIDLVIFRENTEGLYAGIGGIFKQGTPDEIAIAEEVNTRRGVERIIRYAFEWGRSHAKTRVTMADKANAIPAHGLWRRAFEEIGEEYPEINRDTRYIDAMAMDLIRTPESFQVIVTGNLFGDILSDLASTLVGGLGIAPSANRNPGRVEMFEPVHGSAPPLAGKDRANPMAAILSLGMLLETVGEQDAASAVESAVRSAIAAGAVTADLGGSLGTRAVGDAIADRVRRSAK
ncbi:MAG: isocitrate/isopropylmalate dehydrogenase family protein [Gemmatimonadaceae bacterium]|nr:isocitrate/isopropylmalate dehydrogenase family protein [Gemmatimonadaceae bacterium]MDQ3519548.1 isocitrate/isopropylmalate dehydrogenase family protein [Gemmatimonadota bacterium]